MPINISQATKLLKQGDVVAYPTEAVYGLGCDPFNESAMTKLLHVKQRPLEKGVILIASTVEQILPLVRLNGEPWEEKVLQNWPGPFTWVLPVQKSLPNWITGGRETVAVRVSDHQGVKQLCDAFSGAIVSTSANLTGGEPARSCAEIADYFGVNFPCLEGSLGRLKQPTQIWDAQSLKRLR